MYSRNGSPRSREEYELFVDFAADNLFAMRVIDSLQLDHILKSPSGLRVSVIVIQAGQQSGSAWNRLPPKDHNFGDPHHAYSTLV